MKILFLGETYRADAKSWIEGIERFSGSKLETKEVAFSPQRWKRLVYFLQFLIQLLRTRSKNTYDIVLAERATSYGFFSLLVKAKLRVVAQQGITDAFPEEGFTGWYKRIFQRMTYKNADLIHAWGNVMTYAMLESGAEPRKIMILPKGINLRRYTFIRKQNQQSIPTGIVTRSLSEVYKHETIIEAFALLKSKGIAAKCCIVGDGVLKNKLQQQADRLGLNQEIEFLGIIPNQDLPRHLLQSDFYLAVPETEGVSASLFEAMACGCFPIVSDLPANRAFIRPGQNGFLVPVGDAMELAKSIEKFLLNRSIYEGFLEENRNYIETFVDFEKNMNDIWNKYLDLLAEK